MTSKELLEEVKRIKTLADIGLLYCNNEYDQDRYTELQQTSLRLLRNLNADSDKEFALSFPPVADYPTAKVDIRAMVLSPDHKILLVQESSDGRWSLPGGWAEIGHSPKETAIRECKEEAGLDVVPQKLLAVFDKKKHPHPAESFYVYKMVFHCVAASFELQKGFDVLDARFFAVENLPELSENRILKSQIELVFEKMMKGDETAYFD